MSDKKQKTDCNGRINHDVLRSTASKEEPRFLSILIKDINSLMDAVACGIKPGDDGHFWHSKPRFLYAIIHEYYKKYSALLTRTAMESIMDLIEDQNGVSISEGDRTNARMYYDEVYSIDAPLDDYKLLRDNINNRYVQWLAFEILKEETEQIAKSTSNQIDKVKRLQERLLTIDNMEADSYCGNFNMTESMPIIRANITQQREHPELNPRIPTYINAIDNIYQFYPGTYNIISGMINGGKTTLMFNIGFNIARNGHNVVYVSIEKEAIPIMTRLTSLHALVDYNRIKRGGTGENGLSDIYFNKLIDATYDLENKIKPRFDCIQAVPGTKLSKIFSEIEKIKSHKERIGEKIDVLMVDYLGVIGFETHHPGRPDLDEAMVSKRLQAYGKINHFLTFAASQLKTPSVKEIRSKAKKTTSEDMSALEVNTEDLAGSKMIIADADSGMSAILNHDKPPTKMFVYGTKARDDEAGRCLVLDFDGAIGRVSDPEFQEGYIDEVDDLIYSDNADEASEEDIFDQLDDNVKTPAKEANIAKDTDDSIDDHDDIIDTEDDDDSIFGTD